MRFLADESCDYNIVKIIRASGHDVKSILESSPGITDGEVIDLALNEKRILLTEDKDFGQLVFSEFRQAHGVILIRFPAGLRSVLLRDIAGYFKEYGEKVAATGSFTVIQPGRIRIARSPEGKR